MTQLQGKSGCELVKYPKIFTLGSPENEGILNEFVVIESKIDGANFRVRYILEEDRLIFGSRSNEITNANPNNWVAIKAFKKAFEEHKESFIPNVIYFAECFDTDTEILTRDGWKKYDQIKNNEVILTYNKERDILEYQTIRAKVSYNYNGKMVHFKTSSIDSFVTPNHRILYSRYPIYPTKKFLVIEAEKLVDKAQFILKSASKYNCDNIIDDNGKLVLRLLAWIITEGSFDINTTRFMITQSYNKNKEKCDRIESILSQLSFSWSRTNAKDKGCYQYTINKKDSETIINLFENNNFKTIPKWILDDVPFEGLTIFRDEMMLGDGTSNKEYPNSMGYFTKYNELADRFQELCIKTGWRSKKSLEQKIDKLKVYDGYRLGINGKDYTVIDTTTKRCHIENYNGLVWCVITDNTFIVVRRNGCPIITGNSMQKHTIAYDNIPDAVGYDVFNLGTNTFYDYRAAKKAFEAIGIPFVNIHYEGMACNITQEIIDDYIKKSPYRKDGDEGIVIKSYNKLNCYGRPLFAKVVDPIFKEKNKEVFKGNGIGCVKVIEHDIVNEYFTISRFMKAINHFKDINEVIDMPLMPKLYKYVSEDILSENILEIMKKYDSIDFTKFNNFVAKKCAKELKEYLIKGEIKC